MQLFSAKLGQKAPLEPLVPGKISMYACGPTVYDYIHVGNARPVIVFDALRRYLAWRGLDVTFVQNFTDIDDKIINRAQKEGVDWQDIAKRFIEEYHTDAKGLGVHPATMHPLATDNISGMLDAIQTLITKGHAYPLRGDVYFRVESFPNYGKLSGQPLEDLQAGARVEEGVDKENPLDFALWKAAKPGEPSWDSPWGKGRPGWHIECTVMVNRHLGKTIDIHAGGQDLTFPHHENEIAQSEALNDAPYVRNWLHNGFLSIDNKKMSKSLGNFFTVRDAADAYGYDAIRFFMLQSHYRSPLNYSGEILQGAKHALERLYTAVETLEFHQKTALDTPPCPAEQTLLDALPAYHDKFVAAMDDDFNTADAIGHIFTLVRETNRALGETKTPAKAFVDGALQKITELCDVLGLLYDRPKIIYVSRLLKTEFGGRAKLTVIDRNAEIDALIEARTKARAEKNWAEADRIRDELSAKGIVLEDTPQGVKWKRG